MYFKKTSKKKLPRIRVFQYGKKGHLFGCSPSQFGPDNLDSLESVQFYLDPREMPEETQYTDRGPEKHSGRWVCYGKNGLRKRVRLIFTSCAYEKGVASKLDSHFQSLIESGEAKEL